MDIKSVEQIERVIAAWGDYVGHGTWELYERALHELDDFPGQFDGYIGETWGALFGGRTPRPAECPDHTAEPGLVESDAETTHAEK